MIKMIITINDNIEDEGCNIQCQFEENNTSSQEQSYCNLLSDMCKLALGTFAPNGNFYSAEEWEIKQQKLMDEIFPNSIGE